MAQSSNSNNRKDNCGDSEEENEVPTTSKADFNDPNRTARNVNDLKSFKALHFNSADDVRQAMKSIMSDKMAHETNEINKYSESKNYKDAETNVNGNFYTETDEDKATENNGKDKKDSLNGASRTNPIVTKQKESRRVRKRPAKASKTKPSKRYKGASLQGFYWGKLSNLIFLKRHYKSDSSSESDSIFSL